MVIIALFLDMKCAFEMIESCILLEKMNFYEIRNIALKWFRSFLSDRKQRTKYGDYISELLDILVSTTQFWQQICP